MRTKFLTLVLILVAALGFSQVPASKPVVSSVIYVAQATPPSSPTIGQKYLSTNGTYYRWDGASWIVDVVASGGGTDNWNNLINVPADIADGDDDTNTQLTDAQVEAAYNALVAIVPQGIAEAGTSTTVYRWTPQRLAQAISALAPSGPGGSGDVAAANNFEGDGRFIIADGTGKNVESTNLMQILGASIAVNADLEVAGSVDLSDVGRVRNSLDPINPQDVATKAYVDSEVASATGTFNITSFKDVVYETDLTGFPYPVYTQFVMHVPEAEYNQLTTNQVYQTQGVQIYKVPAPPAANYSISNFDISDLSAPTFDVSGAETGAFGYDWTISDGTTTQSGYALETDNASFTITGTSIAAYNDGTITATFNQVNGNPVRGANVTATVTKGSSLLSPPLLNNPNPELNTGNASAFGADEVNGTTTGQTPVNANVASILEDDGYVGDYVFEVEATATTFGRARHTFTGLTSGATYEWAILYKNEGANGIRVTTTNTDSANLVYETSPGPGYHLRQGVFVSTGTTMEVGFWTYHAPTGDATVGDKNRYKFSFKAQ